MTRGECKGESGLLEVNAALSTHAILDPADKTLPWCAFDEEVEWGSHRRTEMRYEHGITTFFGRGMRILQS